MVNEIQETSAQSNKLKKQQDREIEASDINEIYRRMSRLYGHKFTSNYGTSDDGTWLMALSGLKRSDLSRGLTVLLTINSDWPPSVPKFKQMCLGTSNNQISKAAHKEYVSIGPVRASDEDGRANVKKMREAIHGTGVLVKHD